MSVLEVLPPSLSLSLYLFKATGDVNWFGVPHSEDKKGALIRAGVQKHGEVHPKETGRMCVCLERLTEMQNKKQREILKYLLQ